MKYPNNDEIEIINSIQIRATIKTIQEEYFKECTQIVKND